MTFESITNRGEFFSDHYLDAVIGGDIAGLRSTWDDIEAKEGDTARKRIASMRQAFLGTRAAATDAPPSSREAAARDLNDVVLKALGFDPNRQQLDLKRNTIDLLSVPVAATIETSNGLLLVAIDASVAQSTDKLFADQGEDGAVSVLDPLFKEGEKKQVVEPSKAVGEIFSTDDPPRYVVVCAGRIVLLADRAKWAEGRYLAVDFDAALERMDTKAKGELETIAALFSTDALVPGGLDGAAGQSVLDELIDKSHKHAVGVSKELRTGIRDSIEILANEVIEQLDNRARQQNQKLFTRGDVDARNLTTQCLRYLYRLLVLLYAESRPGLGILPVDDETYIEGYSLDRLRELCLVDLSTEHSRQGSHFNESLNQLFELVNDGHHAESAQQALFVEGADELDVSKEDYLQFPGLDAVLFDPKSTNLLNQVTLRNEALQAVLTNLMVSKGKRRNDSAGFISYAQLGINQLGAVYEGLMAYSGFFADTDLYEVAKGGDSSDGTWMLPVSQADEYPDEVFVKRSDANDQPQRVLHKQDSFVFRLSGRDRQRSASYYTPEVLTRCVVKHALAELLGLDDYAPENGSSGIAEGEAHKLLDLTICEPALGSGAFANEAINQLSAEYLKRRQAELGETLDADRYLQELQKVKAHFALHQTYGVDLNPTAIELAEVSLWLNCMYPGLKAPWFGLQLRAGNSLIGCRRATWKANQLADKPWAQTKKDKLQPPTDRKLGEPLTLEGEDAEIHHFLLPAHGWAAVADRKEAKELRLDEVKALKDWRKAMLAGPKKADAQRLSQLAAGVERMWAAATRSISPIQNGLRRNIEVYGTGKADRPKSTVGRDEAITWLNETDFNLGRLRTLMDAWIGLWFWPLDSGVKPPTWGQWLQVAEELVRPDVTHGLTGQLDLFDAEAMLQAENARRQGQTTTAELRAAHPWLAIAVDAAKEQQAFHWDLEFAPVFEQGGFDLQVGNPPWVRPIWYDDLVLAEFDPWWGITDKPSIIVQKDRRAVALADASAQRCYLAELAESEGVAEILGSPVMQSVLAGVQTNLYMVFMETTWRHLRESGAAGLLHPESHFTDPKAGHFRRATYGHLRRHFMFYNELNLFEDVHHHTEFGVHAYGAKIPVNFISGSTLLHPATIDSSLLHSGEGPLPAQQMAAGGRDLRPHKARILTVDEEVLASWARLFDDPGTPAAEARLLRPVTTADLEALSVLADQPTRLADHDYHWTSGWHEKSAKTDGIIRWETRVPDSWDEVILQGPHFSIATPFSKQPNEGCKNNLDYSGWDLEVLPERCLPRTNYQRACEVDSYQASLDHWNGRPSTSYWRFVWRRMTQPGLERSLQGALLPPGPIHVHTAHTMALANDTETATVAGLLSSLPVDYLVKVSGKADIQDELIKRFPAPLVSRYSSAVVHRTLRLNCLTDDYALLWDKLFDPTWRQDQWTDPEISRLSLAGIAPTWSMQTPLRRDQDRRQALVELDALAALMLGLTAEQLCAMYRTQFAVLRKYEYKMVFDAEGRKICGYHQSAGFRQSELQDRAKAGDLPKEWTNLWRLYEQYEEDPTSVDWLGHYTAPFVRADREAEMTRAYEAFEQRSRRQSGPDVS